MQGLEFRISCKLQGVALEVQKQGLPHSKSIWPELRTDFYLADATVAYDAWNVAAVS